MNTKPQISIITPVWDVADLTKQFCGAILDHTTKPINELIIIDNGSQDETPYYLKAKQKDYPDRLTIITNKENRGYSAALNQGLQIANGEYLVCTNNDIWFYSADWLRQLIAPLQINKKRLAGPRYIDYNDLTEIDGQIVPYLEGWMLAFHRQFLKDVGYFCEGFFAWYEDVDISVRALARGYGLVQVENLPILHLYGKTAIRGPHFADCDVPGTSIRSQALFRKKYKEKDYGICKPGCVHSRV